MPLSLKNIQVSLTVQDVNTTNIIEFSPSRANGSLTTYKLEDNYLRWRIPNTNSEFLNPDVWKKIVLVYTSPSAAQFKTITFRRRGSIFTAVTSWDSYSQIGSWGIKEVVIVNKMGKDLVLDGSLFTSSNNIIVE